MLPGSPSARFTAEDYVAQVGVALAGDGCNPTWEQHLGLQVLLGRRSDFKISWALSRLHLFTLVAVVPQIGPQDIENFTNWALDFAKQRKGGLPRGLQTGIGVLPCMVSAQVHPDALSWAADRQRLRFACMARPVVVDTTTGVVAAFRKIGAFGLVYSPHFRRKIATYFDSPAAVVTSNWSPGATGEPATGPGGPAN